MKFTLITQASVWNSQFFKRQIQKQPGLILIKNIQKAFKMIKPERNSGSQIKIEQVSFQKVERPDEKDLDISAILKMYNQENRPRKKNTQQNCQLRPQYKLKNVQISNQKSLIKKEQLLSQITIDLNKKFDGCAMLQIYTLHHWKIFAIRIWQNFFKFYALVCSRLVHKTSNNQTFLYLRHIVRSIETKMLLEYNSKWSQTFSSQLESQWNMLLKLLKKFQNKKLREAIVTNSIQHDQIITCNESVLLRFLPEKRQKQINDQANKIIQASENIHPDYEYEIPQKSLEFSENKDLEETEDTNKFKRVFKRKQSQTGEGLEEQLIRLGKKVKPDIKNDI